MHFFSLRYTGRLRNIAHFLVTNNSVVTNNIIYAEFVVERKCVASEMSYIQMNCESEFHVSNTGWLRHTYIISQKFRIRETIHYLKKESYIREI